MPLGETLLEFLGEMIGTALVDGFYHGLRRFGAQVRSWVVPQLGYQQALSRQWNFLLGLFTAVLFVTLLVLVFH